MRVFDALRQVCREMRLQLNEERELPPTDFQTITEAMPYGKGRSSRTLKNFEEGISNPRWVDDVVLGYSRASGKSIAEIWQLAIDRAKRDDPGPEDELLGAIPKPPPKPRGSGGKRRASRSRGAAS